MNWRSDKPNCTARGNGFPRMGRCPFNRRPASWTESDPSFPPAARNSVKSWTEPWTQVGGIDFDHWQVAISPLGMLDACRGYPATCSRISTAIPAPLCRVTG